jgi:threonylcarbamoyladenosine tRNA methylthiotransferase CDKAL1
MKKKYSNNAIIGVTQIDKIKEVVDSALSSTKQPLSSPSSNSIPPLSLPKVRKDSSVEIIPISLGCMGACTFCQTRLARGRLRSYPISEIITRVHEVMFLLFLQYSANVTILQRFGLPAKIRERTVSISEPA